MSKQVSNRQRAMAQRNVERLMGLGRALNAEESRQLATYFRTAYASLTR